MTRGGGSSGSVLATRPAGRPRLDPGELTVGVVGGGIAGIAAACVLAERGARVIVYERERWLGGRAGAWTDELGGVGRFEMERGFHAFFRQYYNLRALIRRVDPELALLAPLDDYPILGPEGTASFAGLSRRLPVNLVQLVARTESLGLRALACVDLRSALAMLRFDLEATYAAYDRITARQYLDGLGFPAPARRTLFDVFAHSFFNPEATMSAAELLMMFHFYLLGNPEGLVFDVARRPFSVGLWRPLAAYLAARSAEIAPGEEVVEIARTPGGFAIATAAGRRDRVDACVLALAVPALQKLTAASPDLDGRAFRAGVGSLDVTLPFAVWRLWLDAPTAGDRAPFAGTTGVGLLGNISLYHRFEDESRAWAARTGGAVVELHAYAVPCDAGEDDIRRDLRAGLGRCYPETRGARVVAERYLQRRDCPAFAAGSWASRPGVATDIDGLALAGDFVKLAMPSALMERAATSGMLAANLLLARRGVAGEPIASVPPRGVLARPILGRQRAAVGARRWRPWPG
jgi:carotenoid phi-ring synthase / carotenoid chi-ring synthase